MYSLHRKVEILQQKSNRFWKVSQLMKHQKAAQEFQNTEDEQAQKEIAGNCGAKCSFEGHFINLIATRVLTLQLPPFLNFLADELTQIQKRSVAFGSLVLAKLKCYFWRHRQQLSSVSGTSVQVPQSVTVQSRTRSELHFNRAMQRVNEGVKAGLKWVFWTSLQRDSWAQSSFCLGPDPLALECWKCCPGTMQTFSPSSYFCLFFALCPRFAHWQSFVYRNMWCTSRSHHPTKKKRVPWQSVCVIWQ